MIETKQDTKTKTSNTEIKDLKSLVNNDDIILAGMDEELSTLTNMINILQNINLQNFSSYKGLFSIKV